MWKYTKKNVTFLFFCLRLFLISSYFCARCCCFFSTYTCQYPVFIKLHPHIFHFTWIFYFCFSFYRYLYAEWRIVNFLWAKWKGSLEEVRHFFFLFFCSSTRPTDKKFFIFCLFLLLNQLFRPVIDSRSFIYYENVNLSSVKQFFL